MVEYADVPFDVLTHLSAACTALPEVVEEQAWAGVRWRIRTRTFAHVMTPDFAEGPVTLVQFRTPLEELDALLAVGHPFFKAGWGTNVVSMILDERTDWDEVAELMAESYRVLAPKKLAALVTPREPRRR